MCPKNILALAATSWTLFEVEGIGSDREIQMDCVASHSSSRSIVILAFGDQAAIPDGGRTARMTDQDNACQETRERRDLRQCIRSGARVTDCVQTSKGLLTCPGKAPHYLTYQVGGQFKGGCLRQCTFLLWPERRAWTIVNLERLSVVFLRTSVRPGGKLYETWRARLH